VTRALLLTASLALLASAAPTTAAAPATPVASDAWIALGPPGSAPLAAYLTLANPGPAPRTLVGVDAAGFARVEIHNTVKDGSTMRMRRLPNLEVPAGGRVVLGPGRLHLMLFAPPKGLAAGQRIALELSFDDGTTVTIDAELRDPRAAGAAPHHHGTP
jgi:copper(I)-binding protein